MCYTALRSDRFGRFRTLTLEHRSTHKSTQSEATQQRMAEPIPVFGHPVCTNHTGGVVLHAKHHSQLKVYESDR